MQIRSPVDYQKAAAEVMAADGIKDADRTRLQELLEAINSWDCATCQDGPFGEVSLGDIEKMTAVSHDLGWPALQDRNMPLS